MKKRSVSSVLAERIKQRRAVTPAKIKVRYVKFTPDEMAIDLSQKETEDWMPIGRGSKSVFAMPSEKLLALWKKQLEESRKGYVHLEADLQGKFRTDIEVNDALRQWLEIQNTSRRKKRKSA